MNNKVCLYSKNKIKFLIASCVKNFLIYNNKIYFNRFFNFIKIYIYDEISTEIFYEIKKKY